MRNEVANANRGKQMEGKSRDGRDGRLGLSLPKVGLESWKGWLGWKAKPK